MEKSLKFVSEKGYEICSKYNFALKHFLGDFSLKSQPLLMARGRVYLAWNIP